MKFLYVYLIFEVGKKQTFDSNMIEFDKRPTLFFVTLEQ